MTDRLGPYQLGPNDTPENGIYTGDARELAKAIPDESIDLIFTDPVYDNIEDYRWLAHVASRVLRQDRACLAWVPTGMLPNVLNAVEGITYRWILYWQRFGPVNMSGPMGPSVIVPCVWWEKGHAKVRIRIADWHGTANNAGRTQNHRWGKPEATTKKWINAFVLPCGIVFDPFVGGGTVASVCKMLGRQYLGFEIDCQVAQRARERITNAQAPLFVEDATVTEPTLF